MIAWGAAVYDVLIRLYPFEFRRAFGEELQDDFMESSCEAMDAGGAPALAAFWARALADFLVSLAREWLRTPWLPVLFVAAVISLTVFWYTTLTIAHLPVYIKPHLPAERNNDALKVIVVMTVGVLIPIAGAILASLWPLVLRRQPPRRRRHV